MRNFNDYISRKRAEYGDKFDSSDLAPQFVSAYETGRKIAVKDQYARGGRAWGTVGVTTGWRPVFLLMRRSNAIGSSYLLNDKHEIVAVR